MANITSEQHDKLNAIYRELADSYADQGKSMQEIIEDVFEIPPTFDGIRYLTQQLMNAHWGISSHRDLNNEQVTALIDMWTLKAGRDNIELDHE